MDKPSPKPPRSGAEQRGAQVLPLRRLAASPRRAEPDAEAALHEFIHALRGATQSGQVPLPPAP